MTDDDQHDHEDRLIPIVEVVRILGLSRATIYRLLDAGKFPSPVRIGIRAVRWRISDIRQLRDQG
jgi:prophage regulatory protein